MSYKLLWGQKADATQPSPAGGWLAVALPLSYAHQVQSMDMDSIKPFSTGYSCLGSRR